MDKWEYWAFSVKVRDGQWSLELADGSTLVGFTQICNVPGAAGWELVSALSLTEYDFSLPHTEADVVTYSQRVELFFKRKIPADNQ